MIRERFLRISVSNPTLGLNQLDLTPVKIQGGPVPSAILLIFFTKTDLWHKPKMADEEISQFSHDSLA